MKILFLSDNFPPESNAPASRTFEHARQWVADGHEVTIVTCAPNFPAGKLFDGYCNHWVQKETMAGMSVVRVKTYITANEGFIRRTLDYLSFMVMGTLVSLFQPKPDVIIATSPQFFTTLAGYMVSVLRRRPYVFELRDLWPASITAVGVMKSGRTIRLLERLEMFLYRKAALIIPVTESFKRELIERGIPAEKIAVICNGVDLSQYLPRPKSENLVQEYDLKDKLVVGYIGTHGMAHGIPSVVATAARMQDDQDVVFLFAGGGAARSALEADVQRRNLTNVRLIPMQPKSCMPELWSICDIALIPLRNQDLFRSVIPSKLFECMGMGIPVIMSVPEGEATQIVQNTGCGLVVRPEDPEALQQAILQLKADQAHRQELSQNCIAAAPLYSRVMLAKQMLESIRQLVRVP
ncbi:glycosyltransferase family 4 protein [Granulosicoccus antarcticus]|uniref:Teichuronic acid biosynthesis glycosyltransferase TuaH n=1 Tax=Granulosicoccus antarcticus IMCC3135 TaxID=1192854 RepID=A0A2Z2NSR1_9GAMM|nr:glycosyltransferase family 4 protein [Granulosicoccus antarcticus]ASJ74552.1 Putative teichuronic acid biosynthesis glycosyltransferase TuaH [Granulosicoccus antarcticus IMCC3135]